MQRCEAAAAAPAERRGGSPAPHACPFAGCLRATSCSCAAGATRAPDVTAPAPAPARVPPRVPPPLREAGPAHAHAPPAPPPRAARRAGHACCFAGLGRVCRCPLGSASAPPESLSSRWAWAIAGPGRLVRKLHLQSLFGVSGSGREKDDCGEAGGDRLKAHHPLALPDLSQSQQPGMLELTMTIQQGHQAGRGSTERGLVISPCHY